MIWLWLLGGVAALFLGAVLTGAPYVPSHRQAVRKAFSVLRPLSKDDVLVDLGSGDGIVLREAARRGAEATGIELNPVLVCISWVLARVYNAHYEVLMRDMWAYKLPYNTTVVYVFSVSRDMQRLERLLQEEANRLGRPLDVVTYGAAMSSAHILQKDGGHTLHRFSPLQQGKA